MHLPLPRLLHPLPPQQEERASNPVYPSNSNQDPVVPTRTAASQNTLTNLSPLFPSLRLSLMRPLFLHGDGLWRLTQRRSWRMITSPGENLKMDGGKPVDRILPPIAFVAITCTIFRRSSHHHKHQSLFHQFHIRIVHRFSSHLISSGYRATHTNTHSLMSAHSISFILRVIARFINNLDTSTNAWRFRRIECCSNNRHI